jgi:hypothetical protein
MIEISFICLNSIKFNLNRKNLFQLIIKFKLKLMSEEENLQLKLEN